MCARAQKLEPRSSEYRDSTEALIGVCRCAALPDDLLGFSRWVALAGPALAECARGLTEPLPLLLSVPERERPDNEERIDSKLIEALGLAGGALIDPQSSQLFRRGHAGFAYAIEAAAERLQSGAGQVIVGGLDSYYHPEVLSWLDGQRRLHSYTIERGVIPSEGAAFLLLSAEDEPARRDEGTFAICTVDAVETGQEQTVLSEEPNLAATMTGMVRRLGAELPDGPIEWVLSDWNGERRRVREWEMVEYRSKDFLTDSFVHDHLVEELGEVGAASGALLLAIAAVWWQVGCAPADKGLFLLHSDTEHRGAFLVRRGEST